MSASRRRSSRSSTTAPAFPALSQGIQNGLQRLVSDNIETVAKMLDYDNNNSTPDDNDQVLVQILCEKCAMVMKQQQLSPASFLARFFPAEMLSEYAKLCYKKLSSKGSAATLGDRIATAWVKQQPLLPTTTSERNNEPEEKLERALEDDDDSDLQLSKKAKNENAADDDNNEGKISNNKESAAAPKRKKGTDDVGQLAPGKIISKMKRKKTKD
mmetsp:Transcript_18852/g.24265  ORF Transcript_18852/g.24265 Transcript_18852/m.24265 type:complete len:214 (+) Transcript_18852:24-665(+)